MTNSADNNTDSGDLRAGEPSNLNPQIAKSNDGAVDVRFELSDLYAGLDDPALARDIDSLAGLCANFEKQFRGKLSDDLGAALEALQSIQQCSNKISVFLHLSQACDAANQKIQQMVARSRESWARASANHLTFFEQEVGCELSEEQYQKLIAENAIVAQHKPFLDQIRRSAKYLLPENVERALMLREPFGASEWIGLYDEVEVGLSFTLRSPQIKDHPKWGKKLKLPQVLDLMLYSPDSQVRFEAMRSINRGLKDEMAPLAARALNVVIGLKNIDDAERGYPHAMSRRNLDNMVSDEVVDALHSAVAEEGVTLAKRYYRLLARCLGKNKLLWSDRTARPFPEAGTKLSWDETFDIVHLAYKDFSPFLADVVRRMFERRWIDAPPYPGKVSGAFNYSVDLPEPLGVRSYTLLNFLSSERDVMVLAHELGHAVHGVLAAHEQGPLMFRAPMAYAETASIFGEMLAFNLLLKRATSPQRKLALYLEKCSDFLSSVLRQISFSVFEQRIHDQRRVGKLTVDDFCRQWLSVTTQFFGRDGEIFEYKEMEYLWSYVSHFLNPFYVYAYAFGALLTQSLFAVKDNFPYDFQTLYLDLIKAGGTRDAVQLLKPFGLNPADPNFWIQGIRDSFGLWLVEAEKLSTELGVKLS